MFIRIYALAVCFATILCLTISTGIGLFDIVQIALPELTMNSHQFQNLQSNDNFRRSGMTYGHGSSLVMYNGRAPALALPAQIPGSQTAPPSEEEVTRLREKELVFVINNSKHDAKRSLIQILIVLLVSSSLFYIHWRLAVKLDGKE